MLGRAKYFLILLLIPIVFATIYAQEKYQIPAWVKGVAGFWAEDKITDDEFGEGLSFLISQNIIKVPEIEQLKEEIRLLQEENAQLRSQTDQGDVIPQDDISTQTCQPFPETCDGRDNDCDDSIDEGNPGGGAACNTGLAGACVAGTMQCQDGGIVCLQSISPTAEICDGLDNDCDGTLDEGDICPFDNAAGSCVKTACALSSCNTGFANCDGSAANGCEVNLSTASNSFETPMIIGSHCADTKKGFMCSSNSSFDNFATRTGTGGKFFKATARECSECQADLEMKFTLDVPDGVNYDLYIFKSSGTLVASSITGVGVDESVTVKVPDNAGPDDQTDYIIEVRYYSGSSCIQWTLNAFGHTN
jgi:hypothetical protein